MAFKKENYAPISASFSDKPTARASYSTADDNLSTVLTSGYFADLADVIFVNDLIYVVATDAEQWVQITAVSPAVTTTQFSDVNNTLADGTIWVGDGTNSPVAVTLSGDLTITNAGVATVAAAAITSAKLNEKTIQYAEVAISSSEILNLRATPKTLVAAPAAGKFLEFISLQLFLDYGSIAYTESSDNLAVKLTDGSGAAVSQAIETTGFIDQTADTMTNALPKIDAIVAAASATAKALVLHNTGDGEYALGNSVMGAKVAYRVHTTAF